MSEDTVTFTWEGDTLEARPGEPVAVALWRAGHVTQTRSLKYHRPRGPMCLTGDCPGCMVRVDGVPNVRGCTTPAKQGMEVESQTGWPSAKRDVFGIVDRVFKRFDHERMFVRPGIVNRVYEAMARRLAGFGSQPTGEVDVTEGRQLTPDVLVAGGGPAGLAAATAIAQRGREPLLVDERLDGGSLSFHHEPVATSTHEASDGPTLADGLLAELPDEASLEGAVAGIYEEGPMAVLAHTDEGLAVHDVRPRATVLAVGAYEGTYRIEGNDVPGVLGARAARILLGRWETPPGDPVAVLDPGRQGRCFEELAEAEDVETVRVDEPRRVEGKRRVEAVIGAEGRHSVDAAVVDPGLAPDPELGRQAGVPYTWEHALGGRVPLHRPDGSTPVPDVYIAGSAAGLHTVPAALEQGRAAGLAAAGEEADQPAKSIRANGELTDEETEAIRSVWNA